MSVDANAQEANFDGLVGPTHNYAGLSFGNVASDSSKARVSNPREAALQGLAKMKALHDLGFLQGVLPPQERPDVHTLRRLGFAGSDAEILAACRKESPVLLATCCSASSMWTANAATVSPSSDTFDGRVHFTPANLINKFHRSIEHEVTGRILKAAFPSDTHFAHHPALPGVDHFGDEGAANHSRLCADYGTAGVELFVFGKYALDRSKKSPTVFPARQTYEASRAIARLHGLPEEQVVFAQQAPEVIDAGVFHNDVIAVANRNVLFCHENAFLDQKAVIQVVRDRLRAACKQELQLLEVPAARVSVRDAVESYLFNSQLLSLGDRTILVVPGECKKNERVWEYLQSALDGSGGIDELKVFDLEQSMSNGGGPACLRLRVVLHASERDACNPKMLMSEALYASLCEWVGKHYREKLSADDLADPALLRESRTALDELTTLLGLGSIYPFQR